MGGSSRERVDKARKLKVKFLGVQDESLCYLVQGNQEYHVLLAGTFVSCDCPDYQYRSDSVDGSFLCKHIWAVLMEVAQNGGGW